MASQSDQILQKCRTIYSEVQNNMQKLHRVSQDRMKKRYVYIDKQIKLRQKNRQKKNLDQMKFYRNKFHALMTLVNQSIKQSYNKNRFQTQVKNILKQNYADNNKIITQNKVISQQKTIIKNVQQKIQTNNKIEKFQHPLNNKQQQINKRSKSPLQQFFQQNQNIKNINFLSVIPKAQIHNSKILEDLKKMTKKTQSSIKNQQQPYKQDSRIRDLRRQNQELQKIINKKSIKHNDSPNIVQELTKQVYYFKKVNQQLKQNVLRNPKQQLDYHNNHKDPYQISYKRNNVTQITHRNLQYNNSMRKQQQLKKSLNNENRSKPIPIRSKSKSLIKKRIFKDQIINDNNSSVASRSSKAQRQKQIYINNTPQILFENQLIKVMIIRSPIKIQERQLNYENLNPQDLNPNQQKLQLIVLNSAKQQIVNSTQIFVKIEYVYDKKLHKISSCKKPLREYLKKLTNYENIVYSQIIRVRLLDKEGYNEEIKANIRAEFFYNSEINKKKNRMEQIIDKKENWVQIQVKIPVTFIQFSNKPFFGGLSKSKNVKLSIVPNPLYDTFEHTYMNTKLPMKKDILMSKFSKQICVIYGRSFIHNSNQGQYVQSEIQLSWSQKKQIKYLSINTIQEWVYLMAYMFMDVKDQEQQFKQQFRKPSMHVFFNLENKKIV